MKEDIILGEGRLPQFRVEVVAGDEYHVIFEVEAAEAWGDDDEICESEPYLRAYIKWDGCSHVWFGHGVSEDREERDGYLHLCGHWNWDCHERLMRWLFRKATTLITRMDEDEMSRAHGAD